MIPNPKRQREVRLGLVLYGGVSLAIYENGIVQEIYRAILGKGVYELLCELIDSDIMVDVISGTSAGGVNGIMLAYSLARQRNFLGSAKRWRELGDIQNLLRSPDDPSDTSILSSEYYQKELASCYADGMSFFSAADDAPEISELDLFVTGTDANGVISTVFDDLGHPIDVKNHRAVFQLQVRGDRKNDFRETPNSKDPEKPLPVTPKDMATLSRLTSGFPVAFEPVRIGEADVDPAFHRWGKLSGPAVYMDGGILNNKPFTSTISAIASRTATREVERFLIYVEPSPEQFACPEDPPPSPNVVQAGLRSLTSIPSYQSIAADLDAIQAHNERSLKVQKIVESLGEAPDSGIECLDRVSVLPFTGPGTEAYRVARLLLIKDAAVECILNAPDGNRQFFEPEPIASQESRRCGGSKDAAGARRRSGRLLVQSFWAWDSSDEALQNDILQRYDVYFRKRRADYLTSVLMTATKDSKPADPPQACWEAANHFFKLYEIAEWAMLDWLTKWHSGWEDLSKQNPEFDTLNEADRKMKLQEIAGAIWVKAEDRLNLLLQCGIEVPPFELTGDLEEARKNLAGKRKKWNEELKAWIKDHDTAIAGNLLNYPATGNLLDNIDQYLTIAVRQLELDPATQTTGLLLRKEFCRFLEVDRQLLPVQIGSGFESNRVIRVVRFSPLDAQRGSSRGLLGNKVRGTALANFGAFFKKGWRANDIMIGRFDSACLLTECLLTKERLTAVADRRGPGYRVSQALIERTLPNADAAALTATINAFYSLRNAASWETMIDAIVVAAHHDIEAEEWPTVAECTLEQQYAWGQYRKDPVLAPADSIPLEFCSGKASPDELLVRIAANAIAQNRLPPYDPDAKKRDFLEEVPLSAVEEHASQAVLRLGKSLLAAVPEENRPSVEGNVLFKAAFRWIPSYFYRLVYTRRTQPDWTLVPVITLLNVALIAILALCWMLQQKKALSLTYAFLITVAVAAAAWAEWMFIRDTNGEKKSPEDETKSAGNQKKTAAWLLAAVVIVACIGFLLGLWLYRCEPTSQTNGMITIGRFLVSFALIAWAASIRYSKIWWRLIGAFLVALALFWLWRLPYS